MYMDKEEYIEEFLTAVHDSIDYWVKHGGNDPRETAEGAVFSILSMIDGCSSNNNSYALVPIKEDKDTGEFECAECGDIAGGLHELFYDYKKIEVIKKVK